MMNCINNFCYGPIFLSYYDKLFIVVMASALVAITIGYLQGRVR